MARDLFAFLRGTTRSGAPYKPSTRWGLYASHLRGYMRRWILSTPWGTLRLHNIMRSDLGADVHDHPFDFTSVIVSGGYRETRCEGFVGPFRVFSSSQSHAAGSVVRRRAEDLHILTGVLPNTWTLVFSGPTRRSWGFLTDGGWVDWRTYTSAGEQVRREWGS